MPGYVTVTASVSCPDFGADMPTTARGQHQAKIDKQRLRVCASAALDAASSTHLQPFDVILRRHRLIWQKLSA